MNTMYRPRVLLAEDHAETAERLRKLLRVEFDVIAWVEDGRALVDATERLSPDVIVADVAMPGAEFSHDVIVADISMPILDGIDAIALILRGDPGARIVLVTVHDEPILVDRGLTAGALGYVLKDSAGDDLVPAIRAALAGRRYVSRALCHRDGDISNHNGAE